MNFPSFHSHNPEKGLEILKVDDEYLAAVNMRRWLIGEAAGEVNTVLDKQKQTEKPDSTGQSMFSSRYEAVSDEAAAEELAA